MSLRKTILIAAIAATTSLFANPQFFPNSQKYRDRSIPDARGHVGSASIEVRALLNQDGTTDLEVTAAAPGTLTKVQVDLPAGGTANFNDLDGSTFTTTLSGLPAHSTVGVQANVRGVDGARTEIVSVDAIVKRRPDLTVAAIDAPPFAYAGMTTIIRATIRELNGDTGARADCRLLVDGTTVDTAEGIWVDANDAVDCSFATEFTTIGTAHLEVVVDNVDPGDWDYSNNSASVDIDVRTPPEHFYSWTATASEEVAELYRYEKYDWGEFYTDNKGINQGFGFRGVIRSDFVHAGLRLAVTASSDGQPLYEGENAQFVGPFRRGMSRCSFGESFQPEVFVCWDEDAGYTTVDVSFGASDVVYRSWGWATRRNPFAPTEPRFEWNTTFVQDTVQNRFGGSVAMDVTFEAAGTTWAAQPLIPINQTRNFSDVRPYQCFYDDYLGMNVCTEIRSTYVTRSGSASGH